MRDIGESGLRNRAFEEKFTREKVLQEVVGSGPVVLFDIGAHLGESVHYLRELFPESKIFSFEPDPGSFEKLSAKKVPGVRYFNLALCEKDGRMAFYRNPISHTNSLVKVNSESRDSIAFTKARAENRTDVFQGMNLEIQVPTARLDTFCRENGVSHIDLLKIDVQSAERVVLEGGVETLEKAKVVVVEINFFDYYERSSSFSDIEKFLHPAGFRLFSISEISNNPMNGRTDWAEVIYAKPGKTSS
ncbi:MAG: FkbM family methyltransferase [Chthoniobacterales bacterium]|nr:FkbM family methyltransferase [Chthoniobacterales bacterium]